MSERQGRQLKARVELLRLVDAAHLAVLEAADQLEYAYDSDAPEAQVYQDLARVDLRAARTALACILDDHEPRRHPKPVRTLFGTPDGGGDK